MILFPNKIAYPNRKKLGKILMNFHPKTTSICKVRYCRGGKAKVFSKSLPPLWTPQARFTHVCTKQETLRAWLSTSPVVKPKLLNFYFKKKNSPLKNKSHWTK